MQRSVYSIFQNYSELNNDFYKKTYTTFQPNKGLLQVYNTQTCMNDHQIK